MDGPPITKPDRKMCVNQFSIIIFQLNPRFLSKCWETAGLVPGRNLERDEEIVKELANAERFREVPLEGIEGEKEGVYGEDDEEEDENENQEEEEYESGIGTQTQPCSDSEEEEFSQPLFL